LRLPLRAERRAGHAHDVAAGHDAHGTIFITGATSGFGLSTARRFAREGWSVVATYRREQATGPLLKIPGVTAFQLDVSDPDQIKHVVDCVIAEAGVPDVLVNNAGYCLMGSLEGSSMEQIRHQVEVNFFGVVGVIKAFLPSFRERGRGTIINVSSSSAIANYPFVSVYGASKSAVGALTEALYIELAPFGIRVKAIFPGLHSTDIFTKLESATGPGREAYARYFGNFAELQSRGGAAADPEQVAVTIWEAATRNDDRRDYVINRDARLLVLMRNWMPDKLWKKMNVSLISAKPSKALLAVMGWQIHGTEQLTFEPDPALSADQ
jgi:NAD(P)-dependent dehydrogenase (short-subunit alcohol dehydrogenase family)